MALIREQLFPFSFSKSTPRFDERQSQRGTYGITKNFKKA